MSVEFKYFGFFKTKNNDAIETLLKSEPLNDELTCKYVENITEDGKLKFTLGGDDSHDVWAEITPKIQSLIMPDEEFIIITYCDHDDNGSLIEGRINNTDLAGYIGLDDYFKIAEEVNYDTRSQANVIEEKLRANTLNLTDIPVDEDY